MVIKSIGSHHINKAVFLVFPLCPSPSRCLTPALAIYSRTLARVALTTPMSPGKGGLMGCLLYALFIEADIILGGRGAVG